MNEFLFWITFSIKSSFRRRKKTVITLTGISLAVAMLIMLGSIMNGVNDAITENALSLRPGHIIIEGEGISASGAADRCNGIERLLTVNGFQNNPAWRGSSSRIITPALLSSGSRTENTMLTGIIPGREKPLNAVLDKITEGSGLSGDPGTAEIILGIRAAEYLGAGINEKITITAQESVFQARITGIFKTGIEYLDRSVSFTDFYYASSGNHSSVRYEFLVFLKKGVPLSPLADRIRKSLHLLPGEKLTTWKERIPDISQLAELNRFAMYIMIALVTGILAFGISNTLLISVMDRYRYFAALKAIGVPSSGIMTAVIGEAFFMCLFSGAAGTIAGVTAVMISGISGIDISRYTSQNPNFSMSSIIIPRLSAGMTALPQLLALFAGIISALWPAYIAGFKNPSSGMRDI